MLAEPSGEIGRSLELQTRLPWRSSAPVLQRVLGRLLHKQKSSSCPCAPSADVERLVEDAQTALVVAECRVWNRPPSIRSSTMTWPPASVTAIEIAIPALRALSIAVAVILFAPSWVRRFVLVTLHLK